MNITKNKERKETNQSEGFPVLPTVTVIRSDKYGTIEGIENDELLTAEELDRMVFKKMWKPILDLPIRKKHQWISPDLDETGELDWGAFGSVDFARLMSKHDKLRYKIDRLKEELADETIFIDIISERIPGKTKYLVLKHLKMGLIELEHISHPDMHALARHYLRASRLRREIRELKQARHQSGP